MHHRKRGPEDKPKIGGKQRQSRMLELKRAHEHVRGPARPCYLCMAPRSLTPKRFLRSAPEPKRDTTPPRVSPGNSKFTQT